MSAPRGGRLRMVCVGCGYWGRTLIRAMLGVEQAEVLGFCRADAQKLVAMGQEYPWARLYPSLADVLGDPDVQAVVLATPAPTHFALARASLASGKHVFVEKPMTLTVEEAEELVEVAETEGRVLMVGHLLEYAPPVRALKRAIDAGAIGRVRNIQMERLKLGKVRTAENVLWSLAPHDISVVGYLLGPEARPTAVSATGQCCVQPAVEDLVHVHLAYPGNVRVHIHVSWLHPTPRRVTTIIGEHAMLMWDDLAPEDKVTLYRKRVDPANLAEVVDDGAEPVPSDGPEPLQAEGRHFVECVLTGRRPVSDGRDGLRVVRVLAQATDALALSTGPADE